MHKLLSILFIFILFVGCATTRISSFANPKMLIYVDSGDIDFIKTLDIL